MKKYYSLTTFFIIWTALTGCSEWRAVSPSGDEIIYITNDNIKTATIEDSDLPTEILVTPMPILSSPFKTEKESVPDRGKNISGSEKASDFRKSEYGDVTIADLGISPFNASGYILARNSNGSYSRCSGQFIGPTKDVFLTAAHCVYGGTWKNNFVIRESYDQGSSVANHDWRCVGAFSGWPYGDYSKDYAFVKLGTAARHSSGLAFSLSESEWISTGYPSNQQNGEKLVSVLGRKGRVSDRVIQMRDNPFNQGSSGGAWISENTVLSVNSHFINSPNPMYGPLFDAKTRELFEFVKSGCVKDKADLYDTKKYDEALERNPKKAVVGFSEMPFNNLVAVTYEDTDSCPCKKSESVFITSKDEFMRIVEYEVSHSEIAENDLPSSEITLIRENESDDVGCTFGDNNGKFCSIENKFLIKSSQRVIPSIEELGLVKLDVVSPDFCRKACSPDSEVLGYCESLGASTKAVVEPLKGFVGKGLTIPSDDDDENTVIKKSEIILSYGGENGTKDPCLRSDFYSLEGKIYNSGIGCKFSSPEVDHSKEKLRLNLQAGSMVISTPSDKNDEKSSLGVFESATSSPAVSFSGSVLSEDLNMLFGGRVISVEVTKKIGLEERLIITTENGCLLADYD